MKRLMCCVLLCAVGLAGCNTFRGFGQDVERAGEAIQKAVK